MLIRIEQKHEQDQLAYRMSSSRGLQVPRSYAHDHGTLIEAHFKVLFLGSWDVSTSTDVLLLPHTNHHQPPLERVSEMSTLEQISHKLSNEVSMAVQVSQVAK